VPHPPGEPSSRGIDWKAELQKLKAQGIRVYGVHSAHNDDDEYYLTAPEFYKTLASTTGYFVLAKLSAFTGGDFIQMDNIQHIVEIFMGLCYSEATERYQ
jgi:hypothetical protein